MPILLVQVGLGVLLLLVGGEALVRGSVGVARRMRLSPLLIGVVLVGFGTSAPELATSLGAVRAGAPGLALGNVIGSNIANLLLILGVTALVATIPCDRRDLRRDGLVMLGVTVLLGALALAGPLARLQGLVLLALLAAYVGWSFVQARADGAADGEDGPVEAGALTTPAAAAIALVGAGLAVGGAHVLVQTCVVLAERLGVHDSVIGLTVSAVGTSLPELVACVVAALRRESAVALGGIIGSNVYNICGILGVTSLVETLDVAPGLLTADLGVMVAATLLMLGLAWTGSRITRSEGAVMVGAYGGYIWSVGLPL